MIWPPSFVHVERDGLGLWLPVFLLWPLLLLGLLLAVLAAGVALLVLQPRSLPLALDVGSELLRLLCSTRGTRVEVAPADDFARPIVVTVH